MVIVLLAGSYHYLFRFVSYPHLLKSVLVAFILWAGSVHADKSGFIYPKELHYGALNALQGVNSNDAQVAIELNFDRVSKMKNPEFRVKLQFLTDAPEAAELIKQKRLHALSITGIDYLLLKSMTAVTPVVVASKLNESPLDPLMMIFQLRRNFPFDQAHLVETIRVFDKYNQIKGDFD